MPIRVKLTIIFLTLVAIPLVFVSLMTFTNYQNALEAGRLTQMQDLARFKADRIADYFADLKTDIEMAQSFYNIKKHLPLLIQLGHSPRNFQVMAALKMLDGQLLKIREVLGLSDIMLADNNGRIVYALDPRHAAKSYTESLASIVPGILEQARKGIYFSDIFLNRTNGNKPAMLVAAPVSGLDGLPAGIIVFETDMMALYAIVQDMTGLGRTGEILVGKRAGAKIVYLNPLRHDPSAALNKLINIGDKIGLPIQKALLGETGIGQSIDYRGQKVIAAWQPIPSLGWGLVAKIDSAEAFANVTHLRRLMIMILCVTFIMAGIIIFSVAQSIARPIKMLSNGAEIIGGGNLDYRVGTDLKDEIGLLSRSFDKMTLDLKAITASRDELNREIAERQRVENALRESEEHLSRAQEIAHLGSWELDLTLNKLTWSDEVYRIFGLKPQEFDATYEAFLAALHPDDRAAVDAAYTGSLAEGRDTYEIEHRVMRKNSGEVRIVHEKCRHFRDQSGQIVRSIGMVHDITERKKTEAALKNTAEDLIRSNKDLEQFAYVASHDLQEPLRAVAGFMGLLKKQYGPGLEEKAREYFDLAIEGAERMQTLIHDLLDYARVGTKGGAFVDISLQDALDGALRNLRTVINESKAAITSGPLPMVAADLAQMTQVLQNLIANAVKFRDPRPPEIHIAAQRQDRNWLISVRDNGIGIEPQYYERIFLIFQRLHSRSQYLGTGIGLAICKKIVERHGGRLWVESKPNEGSTFYFTIPDKAQEYRAPHHAA